MKLLVEQGSNVFSRFFGGTNGDNQEQVDMSNEKRQQFIAQIIEQYSQLYRITRKKWEFLDDWDALLELIAEFDSMSGEFIRFVGWIQVWEKSGYRNKKYGDIVLEPIKTIDGLIYHFKGTIEWSEHNSNWTKHIVPLSVIPVYGLRSGRIKELEPTKTKIGDSSIFEDAKIEYQGCEVKFVTE